MSQDQFPIQKTKYDIEYRLRLRDYSDKAAQGLVTLLVTVNAGAFVSVIELLEEQHWLLVFFTLSTITALLARIGIFYVYRLEVTSFEFDDNKEVLGKLERHRKVWWFFTEKATWGSLVLFIVGIGLLTGFFITGHP